MMSTTFILVRHGEPRYDELMVDNQYGIAWDFGRLTDAGIEQALERAKDPRFSDADLILSSPYTRSLETAAIIASKTGLSVRVETNLHEWSPDLTFNYRFGREKEDEIKAVMDEYFTHKGERPVDSKLQWESISNVRKRVMDVLNNYLSYQKVIVVCHGIVMNSVTEFNDKVPFCGVREIQI